MSSVALRHFVERALGVHAPTFEHGFPGCFDWERLCLDAPAIVERTGGGSEDGADRTWSREVQDLADRVFRLAHTTALALLCAGETEAEDPESVLERFSHEPEDEEEERFASLAAEVLGPVEESLLDDAAALDERGETARDLLDRTWPDVESLLIEGGELFSAEEEGALQDEVRAVLLALARVAAILAVFRWMAAFPDDR